MSRLRTALRELVLDQKYQQANRAYSSGRMFRCLMQSLGSLERVLDRLRIELRGVRHEWPGTREEQKRYLLREHAGVVEDFLYAVKRAEAEEMFGSKQVMWEYLGGIYGPKREIDNALLSAGRSGKRKTIAVDAVAAIDA